MDGHSSYSYSTVAKGWERRRFSLEQRRKPCDSLKLRNQRFEYLFCSQVVFFCHLSHPTTIHHLISLCQPRLCTSDTYTFTSFLSPHTRSVSVALKMAILTSSDANGLTIIVIILASLIGASLAVPINEHTCLEGKSYLPYGRNGHNPKAIGSILNQFCETNDCSGTIIHQMDSSTVMPMAEPYGYMSSSSVKDIDEKSDLLEKRDNGCPVTSKCNNHCKIFGFKGGRCEGTINSNCVCFG